MTRLVRCLIPFAAICCLLPAIGCGSGYAKPAPGYWVYPGANLREMKARKADLSDAAMSGATVARANLPNVNFRNASLYRTSFANANLEGGDFRDADMWEANLYRARLTNADLRGAVLRRTDLREAVVEDANFEGADLRGAFLHRTDLREARNLTKAQLAGAVYTRETLFPSGVDPVKADMIFWRYDEREIRPYQPYVAHYRHWERN